MFNLFSLTTVQANHSDSLANKNYPYFEKKIIEYRSDTVKAKQLAEYWLKKANDEKNLLQQANAYKAMLHFADR